MAEKERLTVMSDHYLDEGEFLREFQAHIINGPGLALELQGHVAFALMSTLQLAFRHDQFPPGVRDQLTPLYAALQDYLSRTPALAAVVQAGEDPRYDVPATDDAGVPVTEVHNVWTIYGQEADGSESTNPLAMMSRPQDWGDPRWHYERFRFEWVLDGDHRYISNFHGWTDLVREAWQYPQLFAALLVQIAMPGQPAELCGRTHLDEDDVWDDAWGPQPPDYESDEDGEAGWDGSWELN